MVRLVFRPYTQVRRSICTSEPLRASTRVSPASPYSGIVHHLSGPNIYARTQTFHQRIMVGRCCCLRLASITFITRVSFSTSTLAYMIDSLVRVSRRVGKNHFAKIAEASSGRTSTDIRTLPPEGNRLYRAFVAVRPHLGSRCTLTQSLPQVQTRTFYVSLARNG